MANTLKADVASDIRLSLPNMTVKDDTVSNVLRNIRTIRGRVQVAPVHNSTTAKVSEHVPIPLKMNRTLSKLSTIFESARQRVHDWKAQGRTQGDALDRHRSNASDAQGRDLVRRNSNASNAPRDKTSNESDNSVRDLHRKDSNASRTPGGKCVRKLSNAGAEGQDLVTKKTFASHAPVGKCVRKRSNGGRARVYDLVRKTSNASHMSGGKCVRRRSSKADTQGHDLVRENSIIADTQGDDIHRQLSSLGDTQGHDLVRENSILADTQGDDFDRKRSNADAIPGHDLVLENSIVSDTQGDDFYEGELQAHNLVRENSIVVDTQGEDFCEGEFQAHNLVRENSIVVDTQGDDFDRLGSNEGEIQAHNVFCENSSAPQIQGDGLDHQQSNACVFQGQDLDRKNSNVSRLHLDRQYSNTSDAKRYTILAEPSMEHGSPSDLSCQLSKDEVAQENKLSHDEATENKAEGYNLGSQLLCQSLNDELGSKHQPTNESNNQGPQLTQNNDIDEQIVANDRCDLPSSETKISEQCDLQQTNQLNSQGYEPGQLIHESTVQFWSVNSDGQLGHKTYPIEIECDVPMVAALKQDAAKGSDDVTCSTGGTQFTIIPDHLKNILTCKALQRIKNHNSDAPLNLKQKAMDDLMQIVQWGNTNFEAMVWGHDSIQKSKTTDGIPGEIDVAAKPKVGEYLASRIKFARKIIKNQRGLKAQRNGGLNSEDDAFKFNRVIRPRNDVVDKNMQPSTYQLVTGLLQDFQAFEDFVWDSRVLESERRIHGKEDCEKEKGSLEQPDRADEESTSSNISISPTFHSSVTKPVELSTCQKINMAPSLAQDELELASLAKAIVRNARHMHDQSSTEDTSSCQCTCNASTMEGSPKSMQCDRINEIVDQNPAKECMRRNMKGRARGIDDTDESGTYLSSQGGASTFQNLRSNCKFNEQGDVTINGNSESVNGASRPVPKSILRTRRVPLNPAFHRDRYGARSVSTYSRFSRGPRDILNSDTFESYDEWSDSGSTRTDVEYICMARNILEGVAEAKDVTVGKFLEEVCNHLDDLELLVYGPAKRTDDQTLNTI